MACKKSNAKYKKSYVSKKGEITAGTLDPKGVTVDSLVSVRKKKKKNKKREVIKMKKMSKFTKWSTALKNDLPDSAFAAVLPGGKKDSEEKTVPRSLRKLPFKDKQGKVDVPHLRNALVRVAQQKTGLSPTLRAGAENNLKSIAKKYLGVHKETRSGIVMNDSISKFEYDTIDRLNAIIKAFKEKATNKKPTDEISLEVKHVSALIEDLEGIVEYEKAKVEKSDKTDEGSGEEDGEKDSEKDNDKSDKKDEKSDEKSKEDKSDDKKSESGEENNSDEKKEESKEDAGKGDSKDKSDKEKDTKKEEKDTETKDGDEEEESKFKEVLKLCDDYQEELAKSQKAVSKFEVEKKGLVSKFEKENSELKKQNKSLSEEISKFKQEEKTKLLNDTVERVSKFQGLSTADALNLKKQYLESNMSEGALREIARVAEKQVLSKLSDAKVVTQQSGLLNPVGSSEESEVSKMSNEEKLDLIAKAQAKARGYVDN